MYFEIDDYRPDITPVGRAISWREGILISIIVHLLVVILILVFPRFFPFDAKAAQARAALLQPQRDPDSTRFVFVQPRNDVTAPKPPPRADDSDKDRVARAPERAPNPINPLPFSRGNCASKRSAAAADAAARPGPSRTAKQQRRHRTTRRFPIAAGGALPAP